MAEKLGLYKKYSLKIHESENALNKIWDAQAFSQ